MKRQFHLAYNALKKIGVPVYVRDDMGGRFQINEHPDSYKWADYYAYNREDWEFGVNPAVDQALKKYGLYSEWINPGELGVYEL